MKKIIPLLLLCILILPPQTAAAQSPIESIRDSFCDLKKNLYRLRYHNQNNELFDQRQQWGEAESQWDPAVWAANGYSSWSAERVLDNMFRGGYFIEQYQNCDVPFLKVGKPFFDLAEVDQLRALKLLADYTGVLEKYRSFKVYSVKHRTIIGTYSNAGLHLY